MRIAFSMLHTGLANNGGTRTILLCAENLAALGHDVYIWGTRGRYTWHVPKGVKFSYPDCPLVDVMIATGWGSYKSVLNSKAAVRCNYMRVPEFWNAPEEKFLAVARQFPHTFVNSEWQHVYLSSHGIPSMVQYPGVDWDVFFDLEGERDGVGALIHNHGRKRSKDCREVERMTGLKWQCVGRDVKNLNSPQLNRFYNKLKVWFAPTELEGLHNMPYEASMAGCGIVCTDHWRSGTSDYVVPDETALVYPARDLDAASAAVQRLLTDDTLRRKLQQNMLALLKERFGNRRFHMSLFADTLQVLYEREKR